MDNSVIDMGALSLYSEENENDVKNAFGDIDLPLSFTKDRHVETIEGINCITQTWRMKERVCHTTLYDLFKST